MTTHQSHQRTASGFTLVEFLIVIVVIAILAAISIVTYNGVQQRARVSKNQTALTQYEKIIAINELMDDQNPGNYMTTCLGQPADYPRSKNFPAGTCMTFAPDLPGMMQDAVTTSGSTYDAIHKKGRPSIDSTQEAIDPDWVSMRGVVLLVASNARLTVAGYAYVKPANGCLDSDVLLTDYTKNLGSGHPMTWWGIQNACWREIELDESFHASIKTRPLFPSPAPMLRTTL